jgi:hypothetical protein
VCWLLVIPFPCLIELVSGLWWGAWGDFCWCSPSARRNAGTI